MSKPERYTGLLLALLLSRLATAEPAWVSDQFEITLRSGPSTGNAIQLMLGSGSQVEVMERDRDSGYSRVRTAGGTEGWVLTRYLMNEPAAREQLAALTGQLTSANTRGSSLTSQLEAVRGEYDSATSTIRSLEREKSALERELAEIKRTAANVLSINEQNKSQREELESLAVEVATLEQENRELSQQSTRYWFMTGALVLLIGMIVGLWLPKIRWQRRSRYDRF